MYMCVWDGMPFLVGRGERIALSFGVGAQRLMPRNARVGALLEEQMKALDPQADATPNVSGQRRSLTEDLPGIIDVAACISGNDITIRMLPSWHSYHKLSIELKDENIMALLGTHPESDSLRRAVCTEEACTYSGRTHKVSCRYWDSAKKKWRLHQQSCNVFEDPTEMQREVDRVARMVRAYYEQHHGSEAPEDDD